MKKYCLLLLIFGTSLARASIKDTTINYNLPDSVKAVQFMANVQIGNFGPKQKFFLAGIKTNSVSLYINNYYKDPSVVFATAAAGESIATGVNVYKDLKYGFFTFHYNWKINEIYKLLIAQTGDSTGNFSLYSGYIFLPAENKWKLIGTYKVQGEWQRIQQPAAFFSNSKKHNTNISFSSASVQRSNGSWKSFIDQNFVPATINLYGHLDSVQQRQTDTKNIEATIAAGKTDAKQSEQGVYYTIMKEGTGRQVMLNDTVTVNYKGYLFADGSVFDQTTDKPATFPLKRLIKGWQIGVPLCKAGGKIKLVIPSDLAYSIRTRAAKIPPNSILVFEIEVLDAKAP